MAKTRTTRGRGNRGNRGGRGGRGGKQGQWTNSGGEAPLNDGKINLKDFQQTWPYLQGLLHFQTLEQTKGWLKSTLQFLPEFLHRITCQECYGDDKYSITRYSSIRPSFADRHRWDALATGVEYGSERSEGAQSEDWDAETKRTKNLAAFECREDWVIDDENGKLEEEDKQYLSLLQKSMIQRSAKDEGEAWGVTCRAVSIMTKKLLQDLQVDDSAWGGKLPNSSDFVTERVDDSSAEKYRNTNGLKDSFRKMDPLLELAHCLLKFIRKEYKDRGLSNDTDWLKAVEKFHEEVKEKADREDLGPKTARPGTAQRAPAKKQNARRGGLGKRESETSNQWDLRVLWRNITTDHSPIDEWTLRRSQLGKLTTLDELKKALTQIFELELHGLEIDTVHTGAGWEGPKSDNGHVDEATWQAVREGYEIEYNRRAPQVQEILFRTVPKREILKYTLNFDKFVVRTRKEQKQICDLVAKSLTYADVEDEVKDLESLMTAINEKTQGQKTSPLSVHQAIQHLLSEIKMPASHIDVPRARNRLAKFMAGTKQAGQVMLKDKKSLVWKLPYVSDLIPGRSHTGAQVLALSFVFRQEQSVAKGGIICMEPGMGKTHINIAIIMMTNLRAKNLKEKTGSTMICCPHHLMAQYQTELEQLGPDHRVCVVTTKNYRETLSKDCPLYMNTAPGKVTFLISYSTLSNLEFNESMLGVVWRLLLDEGHTIKNLDTRMGLFLKKLGALHVWISTATPVFHDISDLEGLLNLLERDEWTDMLTESEPPDIMTRNYLEHITDPAFKPPSAEGPGTPFPISTSYSATDVESLKWVMESSEMTKKTRGEQERWRNTKGDYVDEYPVCMYWNANKPPSIDSDDLRDRGKKSRKHSNNLKERGETSTKRFVMSVRRRPVFDKRRKTESGADVSAGVVGGKIKCEENPFLIFYKLDPRALSCCTTAVFREYVMEHVRLYKSSKKNTSQDWRRNLIIKRVAKILSLLQFTLFRGTPIIGDDRQIEAAGSPIEADLTTIELRPTLEWKGDYKKVVEKSMECRPGSATAVDDDGNDSTVSDDSDDAGGFDDERSHSYKVKTLTSSNLLFGPSAGLNSGDVKQDKDEGFLDLHLKLRAKFRMAVDDVQLLPIKSDYDVVLEFCRLGPKYAQLIKDSWRVLSAFHGDPKFPKIDGKNRSLLVFFAWPQSLDAADKLFTFLGWIVIRYDASSSAEERKEFVAAFSEADGPPTIFLTTYRLITGGLNLQKCCSTVILFEPGTSVSAEIQALGRVYRNGQTNICEWIRLSVEGTYQNAQEFKIIRNHTYWVEAIGLVDVAQRYGPKITAEKLIYLMMGIRSMRWPEGTFL